MNIVRDKWVVQKNIWKKLERKMSEEGRDDLPQPSAEGSSRQRKVLRPLVPRPPGTPTNPTLRDGRLPVDILEGVIIPGHKAAAKITFFIVDGGIKPGATSWKKVTKNMRQIYFDEFKKACVWDSAIDNMIYNLFCEIVKSRYRAFMYKWRIDWRNNGMNLTDVLAPGVWNSLTDEWNTEAYKKICEQIRNNRLSDPDGSGIATHKTGSRLIFEHTLEIERTTESRPNLLQTLNIPHPFDKDEKKFTYHHTT